MTVLTETKASPKNLLDTNVHPPRAREDKRTERLFWESTRPRLPNYTVKRPDLCVHFTAAMHAAEYHDKQGNREHRRGDVKETTSLVARCQGFTAALIASIIIPRNGNGAANDRRCLRASPRPA